jgi:hypothetical protein
MKTLKSFGQLGNLTIADKARILPTETKIKVQLTSGGRLWLPNMPDFAIQQALLAHKVGRSQVKFIKREQVTVK